MLASVPHQAEVKVRAAASLGTPAARPVMAGSDQRCLSDASATDCAWHDRSGRDRGVPSGTVVLKDIPPDEDGAAVPPAEQARPSLELFDTVITGVFQAGLSLQVAMEFPAEAAREHIAAAVVSLDETIREVRDTAFAARGHETAPRTAPCEDTGGEMP
jgi:hypothetical protein